MTPAALAGAHAEMTVAERDAWADELIDEIRRKLEARGAQKPPM